jgi:hypothetical protein
MSKNINNDNNINLSSVGFLIFAIILIIGGIFNIILSQDYINYRKNNDHKLNDCIIVTNKKNNTIDKINLLKEEEKNKNISYEQDYKDKKYNNNINMSIVLIIFGVLIIIKAIMDFNNTKNNKDIILDNPFAIFIISIILFTASIISGVLINKFKNYRHTQEREIYGCTKLSDLNTEEDIKKAAEPKKYLPDAKPTKMMKICTGFAVIFGLLPIFLISFFFMNKKSNKNNIDNIDLIKPNNQEHITLTTSSNGSRIVTVYPSGKTFNIPSCPPCESK